MEEVVSLQDQLSVTKTELSDAVKNAKLAETEAEATSILRAKVNLLETEKRSLENKIVDLRVQVASTEISTNDSGKVIFCYC